MGFIAYCTLHQHVNIRTCSLILQRGLHKSEVARNSRSPRLKAGFSSHLVTQAGASSDNFAVKTTHIKSSPKVWGCVQMMILPHVNPHQQGLLPLLLELQLSSCKLHCDHHSVSLHHRIWHIRIGWLRSKAMQKCPGTTGTVNLSGCRTP